VGAAATGGGGAETGGVADATERATGACDGALVAIGGGAEATAGGGAMATEVEADAEAAADEATSGTLGPRRTPASRGQITPMEKPTAAMIPIVFHDGRSCAALGTWTMSWSLALRTLYLPDLLILLVYEVLTTSSIKRVPP
jgi:hypothetical protein